MSAQSLSEPIMIMVEHDLPEVGYYDPFMKVGMGPKPGRRKFARFLFYTESV